MGRWRPPREKGSPYITPEGAAALEKELKFLWKEERPKVTHDVHEAAKNGDRSENGDYIYGKKRLREIDSRVRFLTKRLEELNIVYDLPQDQSRVFFGAWVTVFDEEDAKHVYRIVGPDEFNISENKISIDSPLARALLKRQIDDEVTVTINGQEQCLVIDAIHYQQ
jgi:transcription elongation factor GreB